MDLLEFGPDEADAIKTFVALRNSVADVDAPWSHRQTPYRVEMEMRHGFDGEVGRYFLATDVVGAAGPEPVAGLAVFTSEYDNLEMAWLDLLVAPEHRRRGHGAALLGAAHDVCRFMGRTMVCAEGWESDRVRAFAAANGYEERSRAINRRQHLAELPDGLVDGLHAEARARAADYELLRFAPRTPDALIDELARITAAINDAPLDDLELEDEEFPPERIRGFQTAHEASGYRVYRVVARHRGTGELAGHTVVVVDGERPSLAEQEDTAVVREHRGHRLGLLLKADMLRWLADVEPQIETIDTWNAESNDHMVGVNARLGYRILGRGLIFQRRL